MQSKTDDYGGQISCRRNVCDKRLFLEAAQRKRKQLSRKAIRRNRAINAGMAHRNNQYLHRRMSKNGR